MEVIFIVLLCMLLLFGSYAVGCKLDDLNESYERKLMIKEAAYKLIILELEATIKQSNEKQGD